MLGVGLSWLGGTLALHAGMEWFRPRETPRTFVRAVPENLWILGGLALVGLYAQLRSLEGSYGTLVQPVLYAPHALLTLFAIRNRRDLGLGRAPYVLLLAAGTALLVALAWRTGAKTGIMLSFLPVLWGMLLHQRRRWMNVARVCIAAHDNGIRQCHATPVLHVLGEPRGNTPAG